MKKTVPAEINNHKQRIQKSIASKQFQIALNECKAWVRLAPSDPEVWFLMGGLSSQLGDLTAAESATRKAHELAPGALPALINLAMILKHSHRHEEALTYLLKAEQINPDEPNLCAEIGTTLSALGDYSGALVHLNKFAAAHPGQPAVRTALANVYQQAGDDKKAIEHYRLALKQAPGLAPIWKALGRSQIRAGEHGAAKEALERACLLQPTDYEAHYLQGLACSALTDSRKQALKCLQRAIQLNPQSPEPYHLVASIGSSSGNYQLACQVLQELSRLYPEDQAVLYRLANSHQARGDISAAIVTYKRLLELNSDHGSARAGLAFALLISGDKVTARELIVSQLDKTDADPQLFAVYAHLVTDDADALGCISYLNSALATEIADPGIRLKLQFALGDLHDRLGDYDSAFAHYQSGNALAGIKFDNAAHTRRIDKILAEYDKDKLAHLIRAGNIAHTPVFIVGMPRSGTSLVEQILNQHSDIYGAGELEDINQIFQALSNAGTCTSVQLDKHANAYLEKLSTLSDGARYVTDKMPTNFLHLGLIYQLFPGARVIHCCRDPLDTSLSCYFQTFSGQLDFAYDLTALGQYFRQYAKLMHHWYQHLKYPIHRVQYESLVNSPEDAVKGMLEYLNLPWEDACMHHSESKRVTCTASYDQVRKPIYTGSVQRWKKYQQHLQPLIEVLGSDIAPSACRS